MNWNQAQILIFANILLGLHLDQHSNYKIVTAVPPYQCNRNRFGGNPGYKIQVGRNSFIEVPLELLRSILESSTQNNANIYNTNVFQYSYPNLYKQKPCTSIQ